jgi:hypothetical protein
MKVAAHQQQDQEKDSSAPPIHPSPSESIASINPIASILPNTAIARTIAPIFGALAINSFKLDDVPSSLAAAENATYYFNVLKDVIDPAHTPAVFQCFLEHPVVFHVLSYAVGTHQEMQGQTPQRQHTLLHHRTQAVRLTNELLSDPHTLRQTPDPIILAISVLWRLNRKQILVDSPRVIQQMDFTPHLPAANPLSVFGSPQTIDDFARALYRIIARAGGADNLRLLPHLGASIGVADLLAASSDLVHPGLPMSWNFGDLDAASRQIQDYSDGHFLGLGFFLNVPAGLPAAALVLFKRLCTIDRVLDEIRQGDRRVDTAEYMAVLLTRNAVHHQLFSLPAWEELGGGERDGYLEVGYEACRLTAMIYSNAVLFPVDPSSGWNSKLLARLRDLIERCDLEPLLGVKTRSMMLWVLVVAGIAALRTPHRMFYLESIRTYVSFHDCVWQDVREDLHRFLWSTSACAEGLELLWETLQLPFESRGEDVSEAEVVYEEEVQEAKLIEEEMRGEMEDEEDEFSEDAEEGVLEEGENEEKQDELKEATQKDENEDQIVTATLLETEPDYEETNDTIDPEA